MIRTSRATHTRPARVTHPLFGHLIKVNQQGTAQRERKPGKLPDRNRKIVAGGDGSSHKGVSERAKSQNRDSGGKFSENGLSSGGKDDKITLTKQEWAQYYRFVNDPQNKGAVFKKPNGERLVRLENKIVVDDGDSVRRVMVFPNNDSMNDLINEMLDRGNLQWE